MSLEQNQVHFFWDQRPPGLCLPVRSAVPAGLAVLYLKRGPRPGKIHPHAAAALLQDRCGKHRIHPLLL